jgi:type IV pilus assembly protein PilB
MHVSEQQLIAFLQDGDLVDQDALKDAQAKAMESGKPLEDILQAKKLIAPDALEKLKGYILGVPFVDLTGTKVEKEILELIPENVARREGVVPFRRQGKQLEVAMLDPGDLQTLDFIRKRLNLKVVPRLTNKDSIKHILSQYGKSLEAEFAELTGAGGGEGESEMQLVREDAAEAAAGLGAKALREAAEDLPVVRIVDTLLKHAILQRTSDIHIEPHEKEIIVRYRVDGILRDTMTLPKEINDGIVARIKVLANLKLDEHRLPQDGRFKIESQDYKYSARVSILPVFDGEKVVMRLLPESTKARTLEELAFEGPPLEHIHDALKKTVGMILVTGPTGSGKTTSLYAMMDLLNQPGVNISTIEDPVEYRMPRVNQTQARPDIGLTFSDGLRALVRQDPDIIMVGEIRDKETAQLAVNAALTGHLVLSTLHTNSAAGAVPRMIDMGVEPFLIASSVQIVVAQRLVRHLCDEKEEYKLTPKELETLGKSINLETTLQHLKESGVVKEKDEWADITFYRPKPNSDCPDGYSNRLGIHEAMIVTEEIRALINRRASSDEILHAARKAGFRTMAEEGLVKAARGDTSIEEVLRVISE